MFATIFNFFGGIRLFIGLLLLIIGCFCDFDLYYVGTALRYFCGLVGAYCIIGNAKEGGGYIIGLILGLVLYTISIKSGDIQLGYVPFLSDNYILTGWTKITVRISAAFLFVLGVRDVQNS